MIQTFLTNILIWNGAILAKCRRLAKKYIPYTLYNWWLIVLTTFSIFFLHATIFASTPILVGNSTLGQLTIGDIRDIKVLGNYAYVVGNNGLNIVNITNPTAPIVVGSLNTASEASSIAVVGNYAYVVTQNYDNAGGLQLIDITIPTAPVLVSSLSMNYATDVAVVGNYAYVVDNTGLNIIDITNPASPVLVKMFGITNCYSAKITVTGGYAYVTLQSGMKIISIINPTSPVLIGSLNINFGARVGEIAVAGNYAYIVEIYYQSKINVVDITNPATPVLAGSMNIGSQGGGMDQNTAGVTVVGNYLYVVASTGLNIIDITNPTSLVLAGSINPYANSYSRDNALAIAGNYAYVTGGGKLYTIDITNPISPVLSGNIGNIDARSVAIVNDYAYVVSGGLYIVDLTVPIAPVLVGSVNINSAGGTTSAVTVVGNYAYVTAGAPYNGGALYIIDITIPTAPMLIGSVDIGSYATGVVVVGAYAYVTSRYGNTGFDVINITNPAAPILVGSLKITQGANEVAVVGNYAYVTSSYSYAGFNIIDITNFTAPVLIGSLGMNDGVINDGVNGVAIVGDYAYITVNNRWNGNGFTNGGLRVIDIKTPTVPILVGSLDMTNGAKGVTIVGNYAYVTSAFNYAEFNIIDITNPVAAVLVGNLNMRMRGDVSRVMLAGNYAYVANGNVGLDIIDVSGLQSITVTSSSQSLAQYKKQQFTAIGKCADNVTADITNFATWTSSYPAVATISNTGLVTAIAAGITNITAALSEIVSLAKTLTITGTATLISIAVTPISPNIAKGFIQQFIATGTYSDNSTKNITSQVTWNSSNTAIATIEDPVNSGLAVALAVGTTDITAALSGKVSPAQTLTVSLAPLVSIAITPSTPNIVKGLVQQFTAIGTYSDNSTQDITTQVTWSSSNTVVATIQDPANPGLATALTEGETAITAVLFGITSQIKITVIDKKFLVSIAVTPANMSITKGLKQQFTAIGTYGPARSMLDLTAQVTWNSSNASVATINNAGLVSTLTAGTTNITAALYGIGSLPQALTVESGTVPTLFGILNTNNAQDVVVVDNYAYVADGTAGLKIIDITRPATPILVGSLLTANACGVVVVGNYAYVVDSNLWNGDSYAGGTGLKIIDITHPSSPVLVGSVSTVNANDVAVAGNYAYVADGFVYTGYGYTGSGLKIIDITNPKSPVVIGSVATSCAQGVKVVDNYAYLADNSGYNGILPGLKIVNITNPKSPVLVGSVPTGGSIDVNIVGNNAYLTNNTDGGNAGGLKVINIADPSSPVLVGSVVTTNADGIIVVGNYAYMTYDPGKLGVIDVSNPATPIMVGNSTITGGACSGIAIAGNYAYIAAGGGGLNIFAIGSLQSIAVTSTNLDVQKGGEQQFTAVVTYNDNSTLDITKLATWSSNAIRVATVNSMGLVKACGEGVVDIIASFLGISSKPQTVTVIDAIPVAINITPSNLSLAMGLKQQFTAIGTYIDGSTADITSLVKWTSSNMNNATIEANTGMVTAVATGTTNIIATLYGVNSLAQTLTITPVMLLAINIVPSNLNIIAGLAHQFTAIGSYSDGSIRNLTADSVVWRSNTPGVVAMNSSGIATALALGMANITAATAGVISQAAELVADEPILQSISIIPANNISVANGAIQQFMAKGIYSDNSIKSITYLVAWGSSNDTVTMFNDFDNPGLATALSVGTADITATLNQIVGTVPLVIVTSPTISSILKAGTLNMLMKFKTTDFTDSLVDSGSGKLTKIKIISLPSNGVLTLRGSNVVIGQEIDVKNIDNLTYMPTSNWMGDDIFIWNGAANEVYSLSTANVNIAIANSWLKTNIGGLLGVVVGITIPVIGGVMALWKDCHSKMANKRSISNVAIVKNQP